MPTNRKRRSRHLQASNGLSEVAYVFFGDGPFFQGRDFEEATTEEERAEIWKAHRTEIIARYAGECRPGTDPRTWGEILFEGIR